MLPITQSPVQPTSYLEEQSKSQSPIKQHPSRHYQMYFTSQQETQQTALTNKIQIKKFGRDTYEGTLNQFGQPHGFGKMKKSNNTVFEGEFVRGQASGPGVFHFENKSYFKGQFSNNKANDPNGFYWSPQIQYRGSILNNEMSGRGKETGKNHTFQGQFKNGRKIYGNFIWEEEGEKFNYEGSFDEEGNFSGNGKLKQGYNGEYIGSFLKGKKNGEGTFTYPNGSKYVGQYENGKKQGKGQLINSKGVVTYQGQFYDDMPHGKGLALNSKGKMRERKWERGLDTLCIQ